jgi:hypothetical protein
MLSSRCADGDEWTNLVLPAKVSQVVYETES